MGGNAFEDL
jgi:hypothetical protein